MVLLPVTEVLGRLSPALRVSGSGPIVQHLTLWVAFLGAALAAREGKLLSLTTSAFLPAGPWSSRARVLAAAVSAAVSLLLARACFDLLLIDRDAGSTFGPHLPVWVAQLVMPLAFTVIALRLVWRAGEGHWQRLLAALGLVVGAWLGESPGILESLPAWPGLLLLVISTVLGGPLFAVIGGAAVLLFLGDGIPAAAVPAESYRMAVSPHLPAIPLFTLAGILIAQGQAPTRLLRLFRSLFCWIPGGTAVVCVLLCAVITVLTGGSGVTILVAGGILFQALAADGYRERFSLGLLTTSGSLGLLFPPALPLILFAIVAKVPVRDMFLGGLLPGLLLVALLVGWGVREGIIAGKRRQPIDWREVRAASWQGRFEILLPVLLLTTIFSGFATLVESAALTALYAFIVQVWVHQDISLGKDLLGLLRECLVLLGGVLLILALALGLTNYLIDAQVPTRLVAFALEHVESRLLFLLMLNVFLLLVGCAMDIFSATVVVVPLITPLGLAYGIDPVHLGIIFIANLELGYLTPPVGLNLFLASYRFDRPLLEIYRACLPLLLILGVGVLLITYVPWLTTGLVQLL